MADNTVSMEVRVVGVERCQALARLAMLHSPADCLRIRRIDQLVRLEGPIFDPAGLLLFEVRPTPLLMALAQARN